MVQDSVGPKPVTGTSLDGLAESNCPWYCSSIFLSNTINSGVHKALYAFATSCVSSYRYGKGYPAAPSTLSGTALCSNWHYEREVHLQWVQLRLLLLHISTGQKEGTYMYIPSCFASAAI